VSNPPVIRLAGLGQTFLSRDGAVMRALDGIDVEVGAHEFVALIGPSGCGKSTILRLVGGLMLPTEGLVEIYGKRVVEPRDDIGIVFQRPTLLPWLRVLDNVTFPMKHKTGRVDADTRERGMALLDMVGLADFATRRPDELSGGMQQRVAIARSLLHNPDILLMDEPFSALDALTRDEMALELLRIMDERPKTVLFVTHSIPEALLLADRIVVMAARPGRVREIIDVPFGRPRGLATMEDPRFTHMANEIRQKVFTRKVAA